MKGQVFHVGVCRSTTHPNGCMLHLCFLLPCMRTCPLHRLHPESAQSVTLLFAS